MGNLEDAFAHPLYILAGDDGRRGQELHERDAACLVLAETGCNGDLCQALFRELRVDLEGAERVDLVAEEVDTIGVLGRIAEDVEDGAAHGKLPGLIDIIDALETSVDKHIGHKFRIDLLLLVEGDDGILHLLALCHLFGQGLGIGHHKEGGAGLFARSVGWGRLLLDERLDGR